MSAAPLVPCATATREPSGEIRMSLYSCGARPMVCRAPFRSTHSSCRMPPRASPGHVGERPVVRPCDVRRAGRPIAADPLQHDGRLARHRERRRIEPHRVERAAAREDEMARRRVARHARPLEHLAALAGRAIERVDARRVVVVGAAGRADREQDPAAARAARAASDACVRRPCRRSSSAFARAPPRVEISQSPPIDSGA